METTVSSKLAGRIAEISVQEGDTVQKGQLLIKLENAEYEQGLVQAQGALAQARAKVPQAEVAVQLAQETVHAKEAQLKAQIQAAQAQITALTEGKEPAHRVDFEMPIRTINGW